LNIHISPHILADVLVGKSEGKEPVCIILKWILKKLDANLIQVALVNVYWRAVLNAAMNLRVP
jgi:hypothetical protein